MLVVRSDPSIDSWRQPTGEGVGRQKKGWLPEMIFLVFMKNINLIDSRDSIGALQCVTSKPINQPMDMRTRREVTLLITVKHSNLLTDVCSVNAIKRFSKLQS